MKSNTLHPRKVLNKAFLKVKPVRSDIEGFKANLIQLLDRTNETESEEFHKNLIRDFLKKTYYDPNHFINTKGRNDLVIHNGSKAKSSVGVIIEAKKPTNKSEMVSRQNLNAKALHELMLYYLRERITHKNLETKHLIITNINEWFIFDATTFDRLFAQNKKLVIQFKDFEGGRLADTKTDFFYTHIAEPFIDTIKTDIDFAYFNLQDYQKPLRNDDKKDDNKLIALFKLLSPEHLLKLPFTNDSNSLDKRFYSELLHIIGLTEKNHGSKKLIERYDEKERNSGSILEDCIIQLDSMDKLSRVERPSQYGKNREEQLFNVGLELVITWVNRILFLKLLEAQLITYHQGDRKYSFLHKKKIKSYDDVNSLFFQVLAIRTNDRNQDVRDIFSHVPYLNSSLFEPTDLEHNALFISNLRDDKLIPIHKNTVLRDDKGKRLQGDMTTLNYLFAFLEAYDFSSEGAEEIQEDNKTLINASVLGLIFEKINGYKDGSFFTPGFITMYMCRETIRKAILQKFKDLKGWKCEDFTQLYNKIDDQKEANEIINDVKICDPAVGSGHFLVSALNEIISIKSELNILQDREGKRLRHYTVTVENDELIVYDEEHEFFEYNLNHPESQRVQETLFHEKQTIIENCLFGVDINPNSVKICRLRLWIELLKNAYYNSDGDLETLPNIDINIKTGNSLVSRFDIDADIKKALRQSKWSINSYRLAVDTYRNAKNKEEKREMETLIENIKGDFRSEISKTDPKIKRLQKVSSELFLLTEQQLFDFTGKEKKAWEKKVSKLTKEKQKLENKIEEIKHNKIYENAFEWRFEFPEVLNDDGDFIGFDVVIGNPPYFSVSKDDVLKQISNEFSTYSSSGDIYALFVERGVNVLTDNGFLTFIISNKWMRAGYGENLRDYISTKTNPISIIDFGQNLLFQNAVVHTNVITIQKSKPISSINGVRFPDNYFNNSAHSSSFEEYVENNRIYEIPVSKNVWNIVPHAYYTIKNKASNNYKSLRDWDLDFYRGILTGYNKAFIIDEETKNMLIDQDKKNSEILKPILRGRDTRKYYCKFSNQYLINTHNGYKDIDRINVLENYPTIFQYLQNFEFKASQRYDQGDHWTNLRNCAYLNEFEKPKIVFSEIVSEPQFYYDTEGYYPEATVFFISGEHLKYLTALLNSKMVTFLFTNFYMGGELVGKIRYKKAFLEQVPIPVPSKEEEEEIINLVDDIISLKKDNFKNDTSKLEKEIDHLVYQLYKLTEEEIEIIENTL